ncbi:uncharacterized protein LOC129270153 [Lytechinus pictus]|uniref:uncharacterized protein LOC129270153 n=1 Tax=Lytechinus pictus TaxID=7653 RepID=UPI0030B9BC6C
MDEVRRGADLHKLLQDPVMSQAGQPASSPGLFMEDDSRTSEEEYIAYAMDGSQPPSAPYHAAPGTRMMDSASMMSYFEQQNQLMRMLVDCNMKAALPPQRIKPFNGDPIEYYSFISAFEHAVEAKTSNDVDRLYYLDQYTTGDANAIVKSCMYGQDKSMACKKAKDLLKRKFGNTQRIIETMMKRAFQWQDIKPEDGEELHRFSIFVTELHNLAKDLQMLCEVDHSQSIKQVIGKLPYKLRERWRVLADDILEEKERNVTFADVVKFVTKQARIATNPVYGDLLKYQTKQTGKSGTVGGKASNTHRTSLGVSATPEGSKDIESCIICKERSHSLAECPALASKPYDERITVCKKQGLCFGCLRKTGHMAKDCKWRLKCSVCGKSHPTVLHREKKDNPSTNNSISRDRQVSEESLEPEASAAGTTHAGQSRQTIHENINQETHVKCSFASSSRIDTLPGIIPVIVRSRETGMEVKTYAFVDSGSNAVFCTEKLASTLHLQKRKINLHVSTMTDEKVVRSQVFTGMEVSDLTGKNIVQLPEVYSQEKIPVNMEDVPTKEDIQKWPYLQGIELPAIQEAHVGLLIGSNVPKAMEPIEVINSETPNGPFACKTVLGWLIYGAVREHANSARRIQSHRVKAKANIDLQFERLFNQDFNERIIEEKQEKSQEDKVFMNKVEHSIKLQDGHYEIALPLKREDIKLPSNRPQAAQRLGHLKKRFERQPEFQKEYTAFVDSMEKKGYMEKVPEEERDRDDGRLWYLPHHGVTHPHKKKLRVVFDCSAEYGGFCVNRELLQGPDLTNRLFGVLTRFRQDRVALMADIEGMFSQIRVPKDDRDLMRFLWWDQGDIQKPLSELRMKVHVFGAVSSPSCANYALKRAAVDQADRFPEEIVRTVHQNFYVDDCLCSTSSVEESVQLMSDLIEVCRGGGFHLTKWICNQQEVLKSVPSRERAKSIRGMDLDIKNNVTERALGIEWSTDDDTIGVKVDLKDRPCTRRGILSTVSSVYDPIGCVSPVILPAKQLLQVLCRSQLGWDEEIPLDMSKKWQKWKAELPMLSQFKMPRCLKPSRFDAEAVTLHHFCDASEKGYGTVSYLRWQREDEIQMSLVTSKARVAPLKEVSIPRMELAAATLAVRINHMIREELEFPIDQTYFWTDSMSVLGYVTNQTARFKTFVANRVAVIRDGSEPHQWRYVESSMNPADSCSRGVEVSKFLQWKAWKDGPEFLKNPDNEWMNKCEVLPDDITVELEVKGKCLATEANQECNNPTRELVNYYSDWIRLKRFLRWVVLKSKNKAKDVSKDNSLKARITLKEMEVAESMILKFVQKDNFAQEIRCLERKESAVGENRRGSSGIRKTSRIYKLDPVINEGLLRVGGRLHRSSMPDSAKHQVIIPKNEHVSNLILENLHNMSGHMGRNYILSSLHRKYWMPSADAAIRKMISRCISCRRHRAKIMEQKMANLPSDRVKPDEPPFTSVGIDYFGPLEVKRGRSVVKTYGVMFTCLVSRAVHIEKAESLNTDSCIAAIRKFIARRGTVNHMRSDNGTNLIGAQRELKREIDNWNQVQISDTLLQRNIQWTFNPPGGSHHGGVWERQIRTVRQLLFNLVRQQRLDDEGLHTFLCEAEGIINGRPLTKASNDPNDLEALTPNHLILMKSQPVLPPTLTRETDTYARRRWKQVQYLSDIFWRRWMREYLPQLQQRQKWVEPQRSLQVGDLVLVVDQTLPRNSWLLGRVTQVYADDEGLVRKAEVKTKLGVYLRPISKLCFILEGDI